MKDAEKQTTKKTVFGLIIDRSGSMFDIRDEMLESINRQIKSIKKIAKEEEREIIIELLTFNHRLERVRSFENARNVKKLKISDYEINGTTALYDALGTTLERIDLKFGDEIKNKSCNVAVMVYTDGYENASRQYDRDAIKRMLDLANRTEGVEVTIIGSDEETLMMARSMNFKQDNVVRMHKENMSKSAYEMDDYLLSFSKEKVLNFKKHNSKYDLDKKEE